MPKTEALYQEYKDRDAVIIGIDINEPEQQVRQFVQKGGYSWIFVLDKASNTYQVKAIPTSFFLDTEGIIRSLGIGAMTRQAMQSRLASAMR